MIMTPDLGALQVLKKYLGSISPVGGDALTLKLFVNNRVPAEGDVATDYVEAAGGAYAGKSLTAAGWVFSTVAGIPQGRHNQQNFTFTGPLTTNLTIYGYFIVDADGVLVYAEAFAPAFTPSLSGDAVLVTPIYQLSKGTPT